MAKMRSTDPLVWIDCEMTGLNPEKNTIMSICCFITDAQLKVVDEEGWDAIIHHEDSALDQMDEWCINTHRKTGLTIDCAISITSHEQAASSLLEYIKRHCPEPRRGLLAGNSVHCDKAFLSKPPYNKVMDYLSYRIMDVSTLKEAAMRWAPEDVLLGIPKKQLLHQAREDILESILEARYYRDKLIVK